MDPIWKENKLYLLLRPIVDWCVRTSYAPLRVVGKENIPEGEMVIIACNHSNTLMDALVVLQTRREATAFGARADMFRNPTAASILHWLRIVPLARHRDRPEERSRNISVFQEIADCIGHGTPFVLYPEGTHRMKHSMLPLKKGIAVIAKTAVEKYHKPVHIVPAGIDYWDYLHNMRPATISFGKSIIINGDEENEDILRRLASSMSSLFPCFPDDETYPEAERKLEESRKLARRPLHYIQALAALPVFIASGILCMPMWVTAAIIGRKMKDKAWMNTVRFGTKLIGIILLTLVYGILGAIFLPWWATLLIIVAMWYSHSAFYLILNLYRLLT